MGSGEDLGEDEAEGVTRIYCMKKITSIKNENKITTINITANLELLNSPRP